jgi:type VI secretion system protein ImpK
MAESPKRPTLAELASNIFLLVLSFRERSDAIEFDALNRGVRAMLEEFDRKAKAQKIDPEDITASKYALVAFVDEAILRSQWAAKEQWADNPLQLQLFETYLAGEGFFENLEKLRARREAAQEVIEIYYICLILGFEGKYGIEGPERLEALAKVVHDELKQFRSVDTENVSPHWKIVDGPMAADNKLPRWLIYACAAVIAICIALYIGFFIDIRSSAGELQKDQLDAILIQIEEFNRFVLC